LQDAAELLRAVQIMGIYQFVSVAVLSHLDFAE